MSAIESQTLSSSRFLIPPPASSDDYDKDESQTDRGRKRRRSSAANQASQLPSNTLRGRGRRRSSSLHLTAISDGTLPSQKLEKHRSRSPDRRSELYGKEGESKTKYVKKASTTEIAEVDDKEATPVSNFKRTRDQSPSRSRSHGHEGDVKARRRQRTRSRSRSHGVGTAQQSVEQQLNDDENTISDGDDGSDDETAVQD